MDGLLIVDKPAGPTSHDVVARVRRAIGERRVGHTGTLDPVASGVLPLVVARATRLVRFLIASDKTYEATIRLGVETDTYDSLGQPVDPRYTGPFPSSAEIDRQLDAFRGTFPQRPPAYSAKRVGGRRSYRLARAESLSAEPAAVPVTAQAIDVIAVEGDRVWLRVSCSAGFYVRALAHDLGRRLGIGAHLEALRRTRSGDASLADAIPLAAVEADPAAAVRRLVPLARMLPRLGAVTLTDEGVRRAVHGQNVGPSDVMSGTGDAQTSANQPVRWSGSDRIRLLDSRGDMIAVAEPVPAGLLHPCVVLV